MEDRGLVMLVAVVEDVADVVGGGVAIFKGVDLGLLKMAGAID